jgi:LacI family transcriptional regulator
MAAAADLQYTPSQLGRQLAERRHAANGIVFPDLSGPYYAEVVLGYEAVAAELRRSVLILSTHGRDDAETAVRAMAARCDGLVILGRTVSDEVVEHERWQGIWETIDASEHDVAVELATVYDLDEEAGAAIAEEALEREDLPDAFACANDEVALGLLGRLRAAGVDVPGTVKVTGWDDVMAARYAGLTTVRQPMRELGATAAHLLDELITGSRTQPRHELLPTELVIRTSTAPHRKEP